VKARALVAGLLAGIVVFLWMLVAHVALPLGEVGVSRLPDEAALLAPLAERLREPGLYVFPGETDSARREEAYRNGPSGLLVFHPAGEPLAMGRRLAIELVTDLLAGWLLALLLGATTVSGVGSRLAFGAALGAFGSIAIDFSYWNWFDFPSAYLAAGLVDQIVAWALAALVAGWWLGRR
jgi:hypothetical protein